MVSFALLFAAFAGVIGTNADDRDNYEPLSMISLPDMDVSPPGMNVSLEWKNNFGGDTDDVFLGVAATSDGGFVAVGYSTKGLLFSGTLANPNSGNSDALIAKYDENGNIEWMITFGGDGDDVFRAVAVMPNGNIVAAGSSSADSFNTGDWTGVAGKGGWDATLVMFDENGNVIWNENFGGAGDDHYNGVTVTLNGDVVAVGSSDGDSFRTGDWLNTNRKGPANTTDAIITEHFANGQLNRGMNFGGNGNDVFMDVTTLSCGDIVAVGTSTMQSFNNGDWAGILTKGGLNAIFVVFGERPSPHDDERLVLTVIQKDNFGGGDNDCFFGVAATPDGGFVAVGYSSVHSFRTHDWVKWPDVTGKGNFGEDAIIVKYAFNEDEEEYEAEWATNFGRTLNDRFHGVTVMPDGSIVAVGHSVQPTASDRCDGVIVKYVLGETEWHKYINEKLFGNERYLFGVAATENGIAAVGYRDSAWIIKFDGDGDAIWECHEYGIRGEFNAVTATPDGGFVAVGYANLFERVAHIPVLEYNEFWDRYEILPIKDDALIVKYDSNGNIEWFRNFGGAGYEEFYGVAVLPNGNIVAVGYACWSSFGTGTLSDLEAKDVEEFEWGAPWNAIAVVYDMNGNIVWMKDFGGGGDDWFHGVAATPCGGFVAVGVSWDVSLWPGEYGMEAHGCGDSIIVKVSYVNGSYELDWVRSFGGEEGDQFYGVAVLPDGNIVAVGIAEEPSFGTGDWTDFDHVGDSWWNDYGVVVVFDKDGNVVWKAHFGGDTCDFFFGVAATDNGFVVVGNSWDISLWSENVTAENGDDVAVIIKFIEDGKGGYEVSWIRSFGGDGEEFSGVTVMPNGDIVAVGSAWDFGFGDTHGLVGKGGSDAISVIYDKNGNIKWVDNFGGIDNDLFLGVTALTGGGFVAVGGSWSKSFGNGDWEGFAMNHVEGDPIVVRYIQFCTVTFDLNGGIGTILNDIEIRGGSVLTAPAGTWSKDGYVNDGKWYLDTTGTTEFLFGVTQVHDNMTIYLNWIAAAVTINTTTVADGEFNVPYSHFITASLEGGAAGAIEYEVVSSTLPLGLTLNKSTGEISGTPLDVGDYTFEVRAVSVITGEEHVKEFTITLAGGYYYWSDAPQFLSDELVNRFASLAEAMESGKTGILTVAGSFVDDIGVSLAGDKEIITFNSLVDLTFAPGSTVTWMNGTIHIGDIDTSVGTLILIGVTLNARDMIPDVALMDEDSGSIELRDSEVYANSLEVSSLKIGGNVSIESSTVTVGTLTSYNGSELTVDGSLAAGSIDFAGNLTIDGDLDVVGNVTAGDIDVTGVLSIEGNLYAENVTATEGTIVGSAHVKSISGSVEVVGGIVFTDDDDEDRSIIFFILAAVAIVVMAGILFTRK